MTDLTTFIMHHSPLSYRKEALINDLNSISFPYKTVWIESFPPTLFQGTNKITAGEMSLSFKHYHTFCTQLENNIDTALYIEDDVALLSIPNPIDFIESCVKEMKETDGDICWVGGVHYLGIREPKIEGKLLYYREDYTTRCTHAFLVNKKCIPTILTNYHFQNQVDIMLNTIISTQKLKNSWTSPFFDQKSHFDPNWKCSVK